MLKKLLQNKTFSYSITSAAIVMMIAILGTKVTGFLRQALYAQKFFGSSLDLFYAANLLPEVIFNIIALGSINSVIIPVMSKAIAREGNEKASHVFSSILNIGIIVLTLASIIMIVFTQNIVDFAQSTGIISKFTLYERDLLVNMIRLLFISPLLLGISAIISAMLHIKRHFFITQLSPLVYNLSGIFGLYVFAPFWGIYGLAYGVILGSLLHLLIQIPSFRTIDIKYYPKSLEINSKYTKNVGKLFAPRVVGLAGDQLVLIVQTLLSLIYPSGALSAFRSALTIRDIPISLFGTTFSQAAFPTLSASAANEDYTSFKKYFIKTFQEIVFLALPSAFFIFIMRFTIARLAFAVGDGLVTWDATKLIALIMFFMAIAIPTLSIVNLLVRAFYSLSNTIVPVVVSLISIVIEIVLSIGFSNMFSYFPDTNVTNIFKVLHDYPLVKLLTTSNVGGQGAMAGIALASAVGSLVQVVILCIVLSRRIRLFKKDFFLSLAKKLLSSILLGVSTYLTFQFVGKILNTEKTFNVFLVLVASFLVGSSIYIYSEYLLKDDDFSLIIKVYRKIKGVIMHNTKVINQFYKSFIISQENNNGQTSNTRNSKTEQTDPD